MFRNYLITAWRNILKNRTFSLINVLGLALGLAACLLVLQYVILELSYDSYHQKHDQIVRIGFDYNWEEGGFNVAQNSPVVANLQKDFPQIKEYVRLKPLGDAILSHQEANGQLTHVKEKKIYYADSTLFDVFDYKLLIGDKEKVLRDKNTIVITESAAQKRFGNKDPIGEVVKLNYEEEYLIEGVLVDPPLNTHIKFDFLIPYVQIGNKEATSVLNLAYLFVLLRADTEPQEFEDKINMVFDDYHDHINPVQGWWGGFVVDPLDEIHYTQHYYYETDATQRKDKLYALALVGILILTLAWINYVNLATAKAINRNIEVGVRKVSGAQRHQLIRQFLIESLMTNALAFLLTCVLVILSYSYFYKITGWVDGSTLWSYPKFWIILALVFLFGSFLSGIYPALILASFNPVKVLKGQLSRASNRQYVRKALVMFQFSCSVALITGTFIIYHQVSYLRLMDLGLDMEETFVIKLPVEKDETYLHRTHQIAREKMLSLSGISRFTASESLPGDINNLGQLVAYKKYTPTENELVGLDGGAVDADYLDFYDIKLLAGRFFSADMPADTSAIVLSKRGIKRLGFESSMTAVNQKIYAASSIHHTPKEVKIIGVIEEINLLAPNLRKEEDDLGPGKRGIGLYLAHGRQQASIYKYYNLKVNMATWPQLQASVEKEFNDIYPDKVYEGFFLNDFYNRQYESDIQFGNIFIFFTLQAILIACLGLFGLTAFMIKSRNKEIGIRKAMGAASYHILFLLIGDVGKKLLLAFVIAIPIINYFMKSWLQQFTYQINISWWMFGLPSAFMILIAFLTVSQHLRKAAKLNPVKLLRYE
ncbi:ABC transporter permease [Catalinimonas sp. 4WD22]|uniref:ABC transporter permease n=1 Tax=Catalinimonas locisalis TaxID=3133978 RepID=UPI0031013E74